MIGRNLDVELGLDCERVISMTSNQEVIKVENFSKSFGSQKAVNELNFEVKKGEIFGFLGRNGAGKTTTIRTLLNIMQPDEGILACGETGRGRLPEPEVIANKIKSFYKPEVGKVLITYGAISVSIDTMRQISNLSSGNTGRLIASSLSRDGYSVEVIHSNTAKPADHCINHEVNNFSELQTELDSKLESQEYDAVLMLAAVPDYAPVSVELGPKIFDVKDLENTKLPSSNSDQMVIHLRRTPKLIDSIKSHQKTTLVGFKFTAEESEGFEAVESLFKHSSDDYVFHNWKSGINNLTHKFCLYDSNSNLLSRGNNKNQLTAALKSILERKGQ